MNRFQQAALQLGLAGTSIRPLRVGGTSVRPSLGAPAVSVPSGIQQPAVEYSPQEFNAGGNSYFGLGSTTVPAAVAGVDGTIIVNRKPIRPFHAMSLRCPSTVVGLFLDNISIQGVDFFANQPGEGVPIEMFSEVSRLMGFEAVTIQEQTGVNFHLRNPTATPLEFTGCLRGTQVRI